MGERLLHTQEVGGSKPPAPTTEAADQGTQDALAGPGSTHAQALSARPDEYEQRVVSFCDEACSNLGRIPGTPPGTVGVGGTRLFPPNPRSRFCRLPDPNPWSPSRTAHERRSPAEGMSYGVETAAQRRSRLSERRR